MSKNRLCQQLETSFSQSVDAEKAPQSGMWDPSKGGNPVKHAMNVNRSRVGGFGFTCICLVLIFLLGLVPTPIAQAQDDPQLKSAVVNAAGILLHSGDQVWAAKSITDIDKLLIDRDWALAVVKLESQAADQYVASDSLIVLARRINGAWIALAMQQNSQFTTWVELAPESIMHRSLRMLLLDGYSPLATVANPTGANSILALPALKLPWHVSDNPKHISGYLYNEGSHTGQDSYAQDWSLNHNAVAATAGGRVIEMVCNLPDVRDDSKGYGNYVMMDIGGGIYALYAHLSSCAVALNQTYGQGTTVGTSGQSGWAIGAHLHFRLRDTNRNPILPEPISGYTGISKGANYYSNN